MTSDIKKLKLLQQKINHVYTCGRQKNRSNMPAETVSAYYKRAVLIPLLYNFRSLSACLHHSLYTMVCPLYLLLSINNPKGGHSWKEKFNSFAEFYATDLPNFTTLGGESELWERYWAT